MYVDLVYYPEHISSSRRIMHLDFDYFFAQCEEIRRPQLRTKPVVVCVFSGRTNESGIVSTANYIARSYGVTSGIPIRIAKSKLETVSDVIFLPLDSAYYSKMSNIAMSIIEPYADICEHVGIDECYLDVSRRTMNFKEAEDHARKIKEHVRKQTKLTCSIGIAPNKMLAKMASDINKPDGLTVIMPESIKRLLASMDVDVIPNIGPKTSQRLGKLGIKTIGDLAKVDLFKLIEEFGKKNATYMHNASIGIDYEPVVEIEEDEKNQISKMVTLRNNSTKSSEIQMDLYEVCQSVFQKAIARKLSFRVVTILLILDNLDNVSRSKSLKVHASNFDDMHSTAKSLLDQAIDHLLPDRKIRRLGVRLSGLNDSKGQNTMFDFMS